MHSSSHGQQIFVGRSRPETRATSSGRRTSWTLRCFKRRTSSKTVQVAENGMINLPLLGQVPVTGKSASEVERQIQTRLDARYTKSSQVTVFVKEYNSQRVTVEGSVRTPGVLPLRGQDTLMQVIARSGGLEKETASSDVVVFRTADGARTAIRYDVSAIKSGEEPDPQIMPGDVVVVDNSMAKAGLNMVLKLVPLAGTAAILY